MRTMPIHGLALLLVTVACSDDDRNATPSNGGVAGSALPPIAGAAGAAAAGGLPSLGHAGTGGAAPIAGNPSGAGTAGAVPAPGGAPSLGGGGATSSGGRDSNPSGGSPSQAGGGRGGSGGTAGTGGAGSGSQALSFKTDIWPVFAKIRDPIFVYYDGTEYESCVTVGVCHGGANPGARLRMPDSETAYGMLLDVSSTTTLCNGTIRVAPGDPDRSCLILFYQTRLRDELDWVDTAEIDLMRRWIEQGARP